MKTVKVSVFAIGVALSATPFFNSAFAQSGTDSASILLELQTLRTEIAELRDMVERQQFELRKVRQELAKRPAVSAQSALGAASVGSSTTNGQIAQQGALPNLSAVTGNPYLNNQPVVGQGQEIDPFAQSVPTTQSVPITTSAANSGNTNELYNQTVDAGQQGVSAREYAEQIAQNQNSAVPNAAAPNGSSQTWSVPNSQTGSVANSTNVNSGWVQSGAVQTVNRPILAVPSQTLDNSQSVNAQNDPITAQSQSIDAAQTPSAPQTQIAGLGAPAASDPSSVVPQLSEDQFYDRGFDFLKQSKYDEAVAVFKQQIATFPQGGLADDAHYWIAEAMFIDRKPADAKPHLRAIIDNYPQSPRLPDAMLKTAYIEQEMGNVIEARILLQEIVAKYPSSNAAIAAKNRLQNLNASN